MFQHKCIKLDCPNTYKDTDPDAYYCPSCKELNKAIALEVDKKMVGRVSKRAAKSDLQIALDKGQTIQSASGGLSTFVKASDLGITFGQ